MISCKLLETELQKKLSEYHFPPHVEGKVFHIIKGEFLINASVWKPKLTNCFHAYYTHWNTMFPAKHSLHTTLLGKESGDSSRPAHKSHRWDAIEFRGWDAHLCLQWRWQLSKTWWSWFSMAQKLKWEAIKFDKPHSDVHVFRKKWMNFYMFLVTFSLLYFNFIN